MALTPRKEETQAVVDILESGEYDDAPAMAKAVIKEVARMLWHRDWYAGVHRWGSGNGANYGPFASESVGTKFGASLGCGDSFQVIRLNSPARVVGILEGAPGVKGFCKTCGHSPFDHRPDGSSKGKCALTNCECGKWVEIK